MDKQDRESEDDDFIAVDPSDVSGSSYDGNSSNSIMINMDII